MRVGFNVHGVPGTGFDSGIATAQYGMDECELVDEAVNDIVDEAVNVDVDVREFVDEDVDVREFVVDGVDERVAEEVLVLLAETVLVSDVVLVGVADAE